MTSFTRKIVQRPQDTVYYISEAGVGDIDMYSCLLAVAKHKLPAFERAMGGTDSIRAEAFGRVIYYGAGALDDEAVEELLTRDR